MLKLENVKITAGEYGSTNIQEKITTRLNKHQRRIEDNWNSYEKLFHNKWKS